MLTTLLLSNVGFKINNLCPTRSICRVRFKKQPLINLKNWRGLLFQCDWFYLTESVDYITYKVVRSRFLDWWDFLCTNLQRERNKILFISTYNICYVNSYYLHQAFCLDNESYLNFNFACIFVISKTALRPLSLF